MNQFEEKLGAITDQWIKSNAFLKPASWGVEQSVNAKTFVRENLGSFLKFWGISHESDLESVHQRVDELERALERSIEAEALLVERVIRLEAKLEQLQVDAQTKPISTQAKKTTRKVQKESAKTVAETTSESKEPTAKVKATAKKSQAKKQASTTSKSTKKAKSNLDTKSDKI
jgi:hypothetical protein